MHIIYRKIRIIYRYDDEGGGSSSFYNTQFCGFLRIIHEYIHHKVNSEYEQY